MVLVVRKALKGRIRQFWDLLDREGIILNQMLFYVVFSAYGFLSLTTGSGSQAMRDATSGGFYTAWIWLCFLAPLCTIAGKRFRRSLAYTGMIMELLGDFGTWLVPVAYLAALQDTSDFSRNGFATALALCCVIGSPLFVARDIRRLLQVERIVKREDAARDWRLW